MAVMIKGCSLIFKQLLTINQLIGFLMNIFQKLCFVTEGFNILEQVVY